jgi:hypothetical protein
MVDEDQVIEIDLQSAFPLLWLNFQKLNLLADDKIVLILKYRKDIIITKNKLFIVDTRSSLKRAGGNIVC